MNPHTPLRALILLCATLLTVACGGSGGGGANFSGIDRTGGPSFGIAFGTVTNFGSIIVNGVRYETSSSTFEIDGSPGSQDDLSVGDVVLVRASQASGSTTWTATSVLFDDNVEGPITSIDLGTRTIIVLGQTVKIVDGETLFDNSFANPSFDGLAVDQIVEVTGYVGSTGEITATRIEPKAAGGEFEVTGIVGTHAPGVSFTVNGLTVDYSAVQTLQNFPNGEINVGDLIEAKGMDFNSLTTTLTATFVEFKGDRIPGNADDNAEIEGLITRFGSQFDFDVSGVRVDATDATFEGDTALPLGPNVKVEVEGTIQEDAGGKFIDARKVDVRRAKLVRIEALVDSVSPDASDPRVGTFVVLGIEVQVDVLTRMEDKFENPPVEPFTLEDLNQGNYVRMRGSELNSATSTADLLAGLLERDDPREDSELQGFVDTAADPLITILGVTIDTTGTSNFRDENDADIGRQAFFDRLQDELQAGGSPLIKAVGRESTPTTIAADEVEFEVEF